MLLRGSQACQRTQVILGSVALVAREAVSRMVRVEATPINPSDLGLLVGPADMSTATASGTAERPRSNTPVAAMNLLNDPNFVEGESVVGEETSTDPAVDPELLASAFLAPTSIGVDVPLAAPPAAGAAPPAPAPPPGPRLIHRGGRGEGAEGRGA